MSWVKGGLELVVRRGAEEEVGAAIEMDVAVDVPIGAASKVEKKVSLKWVALSQGFLDP